MPHAQEIQVVVELTHHTLHALRAVNGTVEAGGECVLDNKPALEALLGAVGPSGKAGEVKASSVWPDGADWHLATDTEAFLDRSAESMRGIAVAAQGASKHPYAYAACNANDGGAVTPDGTEKWLLAFSARESLERARASVPGLKVDSAGALPAAFARVGAVAGALRAVGRGSVALWDLGIDRSHVLLVTANGVEGVAPCTAGLNSIFEAVQTVVKLKFRGAGARLFFNDGYDFTEHGPKVCAIVGEALKVALGRLPQLGDPPALACIGLLGKQDWFIREIAVSVGLSPWAPDIVKLAGDLGLAFANNEAAASFSTASVGVFQLLGARIRSKSAWHPAWIEAEAPTEEAAEAPAPVEEPESAPAPAPAMVRARPSLSPEGIAPPPLPPKPPRASPPPMPEPPEAPESQAAHPVPRFSVPPPVAPTPGTSADPGPQADPAVPGARKGTAAGKPLAKPTMTRLPFEALKVGPTDPAEAENEEAQPKSKVGFYVGVVAAAALVFAAIAVVLDARMERIKEHDLAQQEALAHHVAEVRLKEAEQIAKEEAERARKEVQAAIASTQKQTEDSTRRTVLAELETDRASKLPGTLRVATVPAGASVSIDGAAPLVSPVTLGGMAPGTHHVRITLAKHETVDLNADVAASKTTDLGTVGLESSLGVLEVTSIPDDLEFSVRPGADPSGKPIKSGRTPATVEDVTGGDYLVTFSRPGCHDHIEKITVEKGARVPVGTKYLDGSLELTSDPSGAWVDKDGMRLGSTPLVLHDLTPRVASFELTLPGYDPTPISCEIPEGQTLKLTAQLLRRDRVFNPGEVKSLPVSYESPQPELSPGQRRMDAEVLLSFVVQRDGTVIDIKVERTTDDDIGRRCAAALARWKFRPGTAADDRTVDVRIEMPFKFSAAGS